MRFYQQQLQLLHHYLMINQMKIVKSKAYKDRLRGHKESVICLYYPQGLGQLLYSFSKDGFIRVWDIDKRVITNKFVLSRNPEAESTNEQQFFKDQQGETKEQKGQKGQQNKLKQKEKDKQKQATEIFTAAVFTKHSIFAASQDGSINQWSLSTHQIINTFVGHTQRITQLALLPSLKLLVSSSKDSTIKTWPTIQQSKSNKQTVSQQLVYKVPGSVTTIRTRYMQIHALINRHIFYQIDAQKKQVIRFIDFQFNSYSTFIMNQNTLYISNIQNKLEVFDLSEYDINNTQNKLKPVQTIEGIGGWILEMKINDNKLYCGCDDKKIRVYEVEVANKIEEVEELIGHDDGVISIEFINKMMYTGSYDQSIRTWEIDEMINRIKERKVMEWESLESKKFEVYYGIAFKGKKKKSIKKKK